MEKVSNSNWNIAGFVTSFIILLVVVNATNPDKIGAQGLLVFFILLYILSFFGVSILYKLFARNRNRKLQSSAEFMLIAGVASIPVVAIALQSLGQLFFRDVMILAGIMAMTIFYWVKRG